MSAQQIDEKKLERAIRKIKHCLALAQSANENEAATALRQAQALMREYRLTEMDVKLSDVGEVESQFSRAERLPRVGAEPERGCRSCVRVHLAVRS